MDDGVVADHRVPSHIGEGAQVHFLAKLCAQEPSGPEAAVAAGFLLFLGHVFEEFRNGVIGVVHAHQRGRHRLLRLEILVYDENGSLAGIDEGLVLGVGEKAQRSRFAMFNLGKLGGPGVLIALYRAFQQLG